MRRPPKLGIDLKADEIKKAILEVVSEGSALHVHAYANRIKLLESKTVEQSYIFMMLTGLRKMGSTKE